MFLTIFLLLLTVVIVFLIIVAMQPSDFRVERSATFNVPPAAVFAQVNDFHKWEEWSPWAKLDLASIATFDGPSSGNGAGFGWSGNNKVGAGHMTIIESQPYQLIKIKLDFTRPFKGTNTAEFTFKPNGDQTSVKWAMYGNANFISKAFCLFMDQDKMLGGFFERGLAQMKPLAESGNA